jgi:hypothetical protein
MKMLPRLRAWRDLRLENNHFHPFDSDKISFLEYCAFHRLVLRVQNSDSNDPIVREETAALRNFDPAYVGLGSASVLR